MIDKRDKSFDEYWEEVHSKTEWGAISNGACHSVYCKELL